MPRQSGGSARPEAIREPNLTDQSDATAPRAAEPQHHADATATPELPPAAATAAEAPVPAAEPVTEPVAAAAPVAADAGEPAPARPRDAEEEQDASDEDDSDEEDDASDEEDDDDDEDEESEDDGSDDDSDDDDDEDEDGPTEEDEKLAEEAAKTTFADLGLSEPIIRAVSEAGYLYPTPIQEQAIPVVLMGRDVLGVAQTGTGKTAGFTLPMLDILSSGRAKARMPRSLILEPTRELALQVAEQFEKYGKHLKLNHALLIGGESMNDQRDVLEKGVDVLIATPGRLLDLFDRGRVLLADCKVLVIDEADRMLDMGFIPDVEKIVSFLPKMRQTLFFSATMAPEIRRLADAFLQNPKEISVSRAASVATTIVAGLVWVRDHDKREALRRLLRKEEVQNALIFCNRKVDVDILYKSLKKHGFSVGALHGDMEQSMRFATLNRFKAGDVKLLVCSDVAARGLDIGGLSHVFNFDVPFHAEDYVHRIGRTGRAGREGHAYTLSAPEDAKSLAAIEKLTGKPIPRMEIEGLDPVTPEEIAEGARAKRGRGGKPMGRGAPSARSGSDRGRGGERGRRDEGRRESGGPRRDEGRREERAAEPRPERAAEPRRDRSAEPRHDRSAEPRHDRSAEPRHDRAAEPRHDRAAEPRRDDRRRDEPRPERAAEPRRDDRRRDDHRRDRRDDLGPAVRGFGDSVPAFMTIPIPRPKRDPAPEPESGAEAEAA
jgi:superfamily II DNA/RNA helicase